jgi:hypothetical protein
MQTILEEMKMLFLFFIATLFVTISIAAAVVLANPGGERRTVSSRIRR